MNEFSKHYPINHQKQINLISFKNRHKKGRFFKVVKQK